MPAFSPGKTVESIAGDLSGQPEQSYITCVQDAGLLERFTITFPAGDLITQADYFWFGQPDGETWAVWIDVDADGTPPTGDKFSGAQQNVEVNVVAAGTPDTAIEVAAAVKTALEADNDFTGFTIVDNLDGSLTFTAIAFGNIADTETHDADDSEPGTLSVSIIDGADSVLQNTYFTFRNSANAAFNCWLNFNSEGSDPSAAGTAIEAAIAAEASPSAMATAIAAAINLNASFEAEADGPRVKITNAADGTAVDITAGDTGFEVLVQAPGMVEVISPGTSVGGISLNPSA